VRSRDWLGGLGSEIYGFMTFGTTSGPGLAKNKQSQRVIMDVLGHRDPRMSVRYTHAAEETIRGALNELG